MKARTSRNVISPSRLDSRIYVVRGYRVMLSTDLAELYGVEPKVLVQSVKRNWRRFPGDFMVQLTKEEAVNLKSQIVTSSWGGIRRAMPYAFTEQGVAMLSSVLNSERAIQVNIAIMRVFVRLREMVSNHRTLTVKLVELEKKISKHDKDIQVIFDSIYELTDPSRLEGMTGSTD